MGCGHLTAREEMQKRFAALNPGWEASAGEVAPDGDVFLEDEQVMQFRVPSCQSCGGILKPAVTFFGDTVDRATVQFVHDRLAEADAMLVAGSSLQVSTESALLIYRYKEIPPNINALLPLFMNRKGSIDSILGIVVRVYIGMKHI